MLFLNSWRVSSHIVQGTTLTLQLFKNNSGTQEKLRLNLHSLSVSELLEYGRTCYFGRFDFVQKIKLREAPHGPSLFTVQVLV
jgi:hypothetical protein